eukprot:4912104-Amphidinium_carterae.1
MGPDRFGGRHSLRVTGAYDLAAVGTQLQLQGQWDHKLSDVNMKGVGFQADASELLSVADTLWNKWRLERLAKQVVTADAHSMLTLQREF